jgi:ABC-2 type transport system permease protein
VTAIFSQARWEQKSYWRNPVAAGFTFAFPLLFLVIFVAIYGNDTVSIQGGEVHYAQFYVPSIVSFGLISACYTNLAATITHRRESGILKRVRGTPLRPIAYLSGIALNSAIVAIILSTLVIILGLLAYDITFPGRYLGLVFTAVLGALCFGSLGVAVSTFIPNEDAAPAIINFIIFPLLFVSGTFSPVKDGTTLARIADVFPVRHLNEQMLAVFNPFASGSGIIARDTLALVIWTAVGVFVAIRRFRWEPPSS